MTKQERVNSLIKTSHNEVDYNDVPILKELGYKFFALSCAGKDKEYEVFTKKQIEIAEYQGDNVSVRHSDNNMPKIDLGDFSNSEFDEEYEDAKESYWNQGEYLNYEDYLNDLLK